MNPVPVPSPARALIAEDEPLLAQGLMLDLATVWPSLQCLPPVVDGEAAVAQALQQQPDVLFLDIRMPKLDGLEAAQAVMEDWPAGKPLPLVVFVSAYDTHALAAFEACAADYLLKPVTPERLKRCCERLQRQLAERQQAPLPADADSLQRLQQLLAHLTPPTPALEVLQVSSGQTVTMIPVEEVIYFEAADKYVRVVTAEAEHWMRLSLRELLPQLPSARFWQVHRGTVVQAREISQAIRDEAGRVHLKLRRRPEKIAVSRLHAARFKGL